MPYIYKYVDPNTEAAVYVGISKDYTTLLRRFAAHERDAWHDLKLWRIYYSEVQTQADAEVLEAHYIALYETYKRYNVAKANWGLCSFAPAVTWEEYRPSKSERMQDVLKEQRKQCEARLWDIYHEIDEIKTRQTHLHHEFYRIANEEDKLKRRAVREWLYQSRSYWPDTWRRMKEANGKELLAIYTDFNQGAQANRQYRFNDEAELLTALNDLRLNDYDEDTILMRDFDGKEAQYCGAYMEGKE